jgi:hypothetical protein
MDGHRFDDLTRTLATDASRRSLIRGLLGGATLFGLGRSGGVAQQGKTTICHQTGSGFNLITVTNPALDAHYGHGDFPYTDCCTDSECAGYATCEGGACVEPEPEPCPPFTARGLDGVCQHPCPENLCQCTDGTVGHVCVATPAGEARCVVNITNSLNVDCLTDAECTDAFGGPTAGFVEYCVQGHPDNAYPERFCARNTVFCPF